nr:hypothetical protein [Candidatus Freyarchaeota archaeon]
MGVHRPVGIIALAIILMIVAMLGIIGGITLLPGLALEESVLQLQQSLFNIWTYSYYYETGYFPMEFVGIGMVYAERERFLFFLTSVAWIGFIFGGVSLPTSIGLLSMKKWGRYLAIITGVLTIIVGIFIILVTLEIFPELRIANDIEEQISPILLLLGLGVSMGGIVVVAYLLGEVKWRRYLAIITGVLTIIVGISIILVTLLATLEIFPDLGIANDIEEQILPILLGLGVSMSGIVVVAYLLGEVKYNFE